ncbi:glycosyltransferase [Patescibacteria group bacterium]|nr:glycosyltransferase [Patescibacteria group bacterium]
MKNKKLKIALFTPYEQTAPPPADVIRAPQELWAIIADELTQRGHNVTLFAPIGSKTKANLPKNNLPALAKDKEYKQLVKKDKTLGSVKLVRTIYNEIAFAKFINEFKKFDIVHAVFIPELIPIAAKERDYPVLFTFHDLLSYYKRMTLKLFSDAKHLHYNSISKAQQELFPNFNYDAVIYNGMDYKAQPFFKKDKGYLFFAGRMRKIKCPHIAIQVARKLDMRLLLAGEKYPDEQDYYDKEIEPFLSKKIKFIGMQPRKKMPKLYGQAKITLMPINAPESFGLVMTESMASGTPVIAFDKGSPKEIIKDGVTGYVVKNQKQMIKAAKKILSMKQNDYLAMRRACREYVEDTFSVERMVSGYENLYYKILNQHK